MSPENFVYWLQGWFELNKTIDHREGASKETLQVIEDHLALVLKKETPIRNKPVEIAAQPIDKDPIFSKPFPGTITSPIFKMPLIGPNGPEVDPSYWQDPSKLKITC